MTAPSQWIPQAAAIPVRDGRVCLITSRSGKRWIIPKGILDAGKTATEIALLESWEEAGLTGALRPAPVGTYLYEKYGGTCHVTVFVMDVSAVADDWPERSQRRRAWLPPAEAVERLDDPGLRDLVRAAIE
jgi:8-oxo-dGTP pyrophosphatase MutT (NUDIX family)